MRIFRVLRDKPRVTWDEFFWKALNPVVLWFGFAGAFLIFCAYQAVKTAGGGD